MISGQSFVSCRQLANAILLVITIDSWVKTEVRHNPVTKTMQRIGTLTLEM